MAPSPQPNRKPIWEIWNLPEEGPPTPTQGRELSPSPICYRKWLLAPFDRRANENTWKLLYNPAMREPRGMWAELITLRAKPMALFSQGTWSMGQLKLRS